MFAEIENVHANPRRGWTALVSFTLQAAAVAAALTIPLLHPNSLPEAFAHRRIFVPISQPEAPANTPAESTSPKRNCDLGLAIPPIIVTRDNGVHFGHARPIAGPTDGHRTCRWNPAVRQVPGPNSGAGPITRCYARF